MWRYIAFARYFYKKTALLRPYRYNAVTLYYKTTGYYSLLNQSHDP